MLAVLRCLQLDRDEIESLRQARLLEEEKAQYSVRMIADILVVLLLSVIVTVLTKNHFLLA